MPNIVLDKEKYKAALLYMLKKLNGIEGKKKAYKLFYFLDFDFYEAYEKPFTGDVYVALPMGPAPKYFDAIVEEMSSEGLIEIKKSRRLPYHSNDTVGYKAKAETKYKFTDKERAMLDRIIKLYGNATGTDLEKLSHAQAPYSAVDSYEIIPYEFSFYRDTPDLK